jgi:hypothetical protein
VKTSCKTRNALRFSSPQNVLLSHRTNQAHLVIIRKSQKGNETVTAGGSSWADRWSALLNLGSVSSYSLPVASLMDRWSFLKLPVHLQKEALNKMTRSQGEALSSSLLNYIQKFTIIEDRLNLLERFNVSAINKGTLLNQIL